MGTKRTAGAAGFGSSGAGGWFRRRRVKAHGPAVILWAVCIYALAQVALFSVSDRWKSVGPLNESRKWPRLREIATANPDRPLALMLGSSRVCWAFQAGRLNGMRDTDGRPLQFYNFGIPATGSIHALLYVRDMLAEGIHPNLLLIEYLPPLLSEAHGTWPSEEYFAPMAWTTASDLLRLNPYFSRHKQQKWKEWIEARAASWYSFRNQIGDETRKLLLGKGPIPPPKIDEWGACILNEPPPPELRESDKAFSLDLYRPPLASYRVGHGPSRALRELLELCRRENIRVVMVVMPESAAFRALYTAETSKTAREYLDGLVRRYGLDVIDADEWLPDDEFEDGHHVMAPGAEHFSVRLREELQRLLDRPADRLQPSPQPDPTQAGRHPSSHHAAKLHAAGLWH